jgi:hypothetical protein
MPQLLCSTIHSFPTIQNICYQEQIHGIFLVTRCVHGSALHRDRGIAGSEAHSNSVDDSASLMADNVWNGE